MKCRQPDLIVFAKQPLAGEVKTRLQPHYTDVQAAEIAAEMVRATVELVVPNWPGDVYLYGAPDADHPLFIELERAHGIRRRAQCAGDLGARMLAALREGIERRGSAAIIGCDVPHCDPWILDEANDLVARGGGVLGPAADGGYYFIGLSRAPAELFENMPWGSDEVLGETLARGERLGLEFDLLPILRDIDTADDLRDVAQHFERLRTTL